MTSIQALSWNHRKPGQSEKGKNQAGITCKAITNICSGGGRTRSSAETSVMEGERRGSVMQF
jgi:hypothetical protein